MFDKFYYIWRLLEEPNVHRVIIETTGDKEIERFGVSMDTGRPYRKPNECTWTIYGVLPLRWYTVNNKEYNGGDAIAKIENGEKFRMYIRDGSIAAYFPVDDSDSMFAWIDAVYPDGADFFDHGYDCSAYGVGYVPNRVPPILVAGLLKWLEVVDGKVVFDKCDNGYEVAITRLHNQPKHLRYTNETIYFTSGKTLKATPENLVLRMLMEAEVIKPNIYDPEFRRIYLDREEEDL